MHHEKYLEMSLQERWIANGKLQHLYSNYSAAFDELNRIIEAGEKAKMFEDVKFFDLDKEEGGEDA